ncbi:metalloregulator ArsR/SmtB family transcription factor [Paenalkalicoccus suaedae]|uniref:Metalloregulator ArsR/SmtB family transcription factor n=1 Tax=Paenalkalicoccus suaedae TaxID=2592382 RepID=A0A859FH79_9BACI|nr:metalloregulator ArsR/SmtB family transcription factor [Paenalkalicoccus suaedae]QKS72487.1 metalloregulator ArsR/SmtB family transcription factor [Paenalkalicoccus suaedae]
MQLDRLVAFHKTLGDKTRLRILALLKKGPLHGQALAGKLGLKAPTITHHMTKLREIGLVSQRRDKNTIYFHLEEDRLARMSSAILNLSEPEFVVGDEKSKVVANFTDGSGRLTQLPAQRKKRLMLLEYMLRGLEQGRAYEEREVNEHIKQFYDDYATVRREFIMSHFMFRQDGVYELNPRDMWPI